MKAGKRKKNITGKKIQPVEAPGGSFGKDTDAVVDDGAKHLEVSFPIVGIGASAGGLAAFEAFFSGMPTDRDPGMAFVVVQHLAPDHKSILTELIRRYTRMQVFEVEDGMRVQPNCTYIIPPNRDMAFLNGVLQLLEPSAQRGQRLPIDFFFRSLARDQRERAIGIVLSGTGSDGTLGVKAIKGEGGMVMAQNPKSTEYDGMPRSAIGTGLVDYELPPAEMAAQLMAYAVHAYGRSRQPGLVPSPSAESALKKVFVLIRDQTGHDFSFYKPSTINRRIERRMIVNQIGTMDTYVKFLQQTPAEVSALFRDFLIGVTCFFRDSEAFKLIEDQVIPKLFVGKPAGTPIRVWSPGCSTGEEAYSLAILLAERQEAMKKSYPIQVFATDIDAQAIASARIGLYPAGISTDITPERLSRFFTLESSGTAYRIHKGIRDMLVFSEQDVIRDPPFSKLELISCRNLMIYMGGELQKKLIPLFHYALNPDGTLFLGTSETIGDFNELFTAIDRKLKVYQRKQSGRYFQRAGFSKFLSPVSALESILPRPSASKVFPPKLPLRELTEQAILREVAPVGVLVNGQGDILYFHGRAGLFLEPAAGEPGINNILKMAREGLKHELSNALHKAVRNKEVVRTAVLCVKTNGHNLLVGVRIHPVAAAVASLESFVYLVLLTEVQAVDPVSGASSTGNARQQPEAEIRIAALNQELQAKEEFLRAANEELETSNEELKSFNEEMQSVNEEMQSTNEELETSKEELQSVNEELATVNAELQTKVADLSRANNDMNNLLAGTGIATVFVDHQMRILRFTATASAIINLILSDTGRPVNHILTNLTGYDRLTADTQAVLDTLVSKEVEVQTLAGQWYTLRIQPYRTLDNMIEGAVITFVDITEIVRTRAILRESQELFRKLFNEAPIGIALIDSATGQIHEVNSKFAQIAGRTTEEMTKLDWMSITHPDDIQKDLDEMALLNAGKISGFRMEKRYLRPDGTAVWINMTIAPMMVAVNEQLRHFCMIEDITERKREEDALRKANEILRLAAVMRDANDAIIVQDMQGRIIAWNPGAVKMYGWSEAEALAMLSRDRIPETLREEALTRVERLSRAETLEADLTRRICKDGSVKEVSIISTVLLDEAGLMYAIATTERLKAVKSG
ncbi:MAG: chemotaxis protein CheB [Candidatus Omnitrophota bacterium]